MNLPADITGDDFIIDVEATGLDVMRDRPLFLGWRLPEHNRYGVVGWTEAVVDWLNDNLPLAGRIVAHNLKYDGHMLLQGGVLPSVLDYVPFHCTMIGEQLCDEHRMSYSLDALAGDFLTAGKVTSVFQVLADRFGGKPDASQLRYIQHAPINLIEEYVNRDTDLCHRLMVHQHREFHTQSLPRALIDTEMEVTKVLMRMERRGVPIFPDRAANAVYAMRDEIDAADDDLWQTVGYRTNPRSQKALEYAFHALGLPPMESFDREHLEVVNHPVAQKILDYRQILTLNDVFILGLQNFIGPDGRIHCNFNQNRHEEGGTRTGRLSATEPNLQQIPMRVERVAKVVRSLFGLKEHRWCSGDWSQFEYRIFGHFVGDDNVLSAYRNDPRTDFHQLLADITGVPRGKAKRVNLSLVFGAGDGKTAKMLGMPCTEYVENGKTRWKPGPEAEALFAQYHSRFPKARPYLRSSAQEAEAKGYVTSILGRRIRFPDRSKAYKAGGLRFQASAADLMKKKLIELDRALMREGNGAELILPVHDEFDALCPDGEEACTCVIMREVMEDVPELSLPVLADVSSGGDWWEASS